MSEQEGTSGYKIARELANNISVHLTKSITMEEALNLNSITTLKALSLKAVLTHRTFDLADTALQLFAVGKNIAGIILTRSVLECVALTYYISKKISDFIENHDEKQLDDILTRCMLGSKNNFTNVSSINIMTAIDKMGKDYAGFKAMFESLCEYAHPNFMGTDGGYGTLIKDEAGDYCNEYGSHAQADIEVIGLYPLCLTLSEFEVINRALGEKITSLDEYFGQQAA